MSGGPLWLAGAALAVGGSLGTGLCMLQAMEKRAAQLKELAQAFRILASEVSYSHAALPEALFRCADKMEGRLGQCLKKTGEEIGGNRGYSLQQCWQEEMKSYVEGSALGKKERDLLLAFPLRIGFADGGLQEQSLLGFARELETLAEEARTERKEKQRVVLGLSAAAGLMAAILLC